MLNLIEGLMYEAGQLFLAPVLLAIAVAFLYAFHALGAFMLQAAQRRAGRPAGFELEAVRRSDPQLDLAALEALAVKRLEPVRLAARVAPMLGLVATMIPMGPALRALGEGQMAEVSRSLSVAFSAVILALLAAALSFVVATVRRRWYAQDLAAIEAGGGHPVPGDGAMERAS
ncbi:MAG: MotA/TolQ/ExbB proton channel family protein [Zoogloea sp.]|nr:MotA/TolQ/ExbB proton channel family protein [Zoogloea sp.]MCA0188202.1 MotA/TolQ/ExbB proton channel family protein [Pseudomonadota bacterium]